MTFIAQIVNVKEHSSVTTDIVHLSHVIQELDFTVYISLMYKLLFQVSCFIPSVFKFICDEIPNISLTRSR